jgi:raffinose/stachyose/melibiose transport system substrate-binding protein
VTNQATPRRRRSRVLGAGMAAVAVGTLAVSVLPVASAAPRASGSTTITIWNDPLASSSSTVPASKSFLTKGVALFEKANPSIKVKVLQEPYAASTQFDTLLRSSEVAGTTPDIGQLYVGGQIVQNDKFLDPLNSVLSASYIKSLYDGWQFTTSGFKTGGQIYGVPYGAGYWYFVYYNKADFTKAGITTLPTDWAGLLADAKTLKAKGITPFDFGEKEGYFGAWSQDAMIAGLIGTPGVLNMFTGKLSVDNPAIKAAYTAWHGLYADKLTNSDAASLTYTTGVADFAAGKAAMTITGQFYDNQITQGLHDNVGVFPVPPLPGAKYPHVLSGGPNNAYVVFKTTKHLAADIKLIQFLTSLPVQELSIPELGQLPNNTSFQTTAAFLKSQPILSSVYHYIVQEHYVLSEAFDNVMPGSICNYWYQTNNGVFGGTLSPSSAAASLESQMKNYLATANS